MARLWDLRTLRSAAFSSSFKSLAIITGNLLSLPKMRIQDGVAVPLGGGGSLFKIASRIRDVPCRDPDEVDQLQKSKLDHIQYAIGMPVLTLVLHVLNTDLGCDIFSKSGFRHHECLSYFCLVELFLCLFAEDSETGGKPGEVANLRFETMPTSDLGPAWVEELVSILAYNSLFLVDVTFGIALDNCFNILRWHFV
ncbi:hypothetical protein Tco_0493261 [Tanacetum coccineum]